jgi:hypothetical protein
VDSAANTSSKAPRLPSKDWTSITSMSSSAIATIPTSPWKRSAEPSTG